MALNLLEALRVSPCLVLLVFAGLAVGTLKLPSSNLSPRIPLAVFSRPKLENVYTTVAKIICGQGKNMKEKLFAHQFMVSPLRPFLISRRLAGNSHPVSKMK